jgi:alanine racemase
VTVTVDLSAIRHNVSVLREKAGSADLMAVVKADAYGHGAVEVARACHEAGVRHFAVARVEEGAALRDAGLDSPILVLGAPCAAELAACAAHDLDVTVSSQDVAEAVIAQAARTPLRVHVKVDTGMGRLGLAPGDAPDVLRRLEQAPGVTLAGLWTHYATADEPGSAFAKTQRDRFAAVLRETDVPVDRVHADNTGALLTLRDGAFGTSPRLVRTGIALYGLAATEALSERIDLRPALQWSACITHLRTAAPGTPVSYGSRWRASEPTRIATLGVGYGDGYPRLLSGRASVRVGGALRPVVGTICMDMCMVDLGPPNGDLARRVERGDRAVLMGPSGPTAYDLARWAETIPYEICCSVSTRVPRRYAGRSTSASPSHAHSAALLAG